jgi:hypothetical protein
LRVALETSNGIGKLVQLFFPVVPKGRMPQVMGEAGDFHYIGITAQRLPQLAGDLGDFQGVGQSSPGKVILPGNEDLGLRGQPSQAR